LLLAGSVPAKQTIARDLSGMIYVEYLVLVGVVGLVVAGGIAALGFPLLRSYRFLELIVSSPAP
jgi:Flp pilus assembly pilin Flp